jgi:hypothetical protein
MLLRSKNHEGCVNLKYQYDYAFTFSNVNLILSIVLVDDVELIQLASDVISGTRVSIPIYVHSIRCKICILFSLVSLVLLVI